MSSNDHELKKAANIARQALPLATSLRLPVNPINYTVLYEYVSGENPALGQEFDRLQQEHEALSIEHLQSLYENYIHQGDTKQAEKLREALIGVLSSTKASLTKAHLKSKAYHEQLGLALGSLENTDAFDGAEIASVVKSLIDQTLRMQSMSNNLRTELDSANADLETIKKDYIRVQKESLYDPLTGIYNRRALNTELAKLTKEAKEDNMPLSCIMLDIDHFKQLNDSLGHNIGDAVLCWIGRVISKMIRGEDVLARFGGEEFIILLPNTTLNNALTVSENIRTRICGKDIRLNEISIGRVTASFGVAQWDRADTSSDFINRADKALYKAKDSGRNQVCS